MKPTPRAKLRVCEEGTTTLPMMASSKRRDYAYHSHSHLKLKPSVNVVPPPRQVLVDRNS